MLDPVDNDKCIRQPHFHWVIGRTYLCDQDRNFFVSKDDASVYEEGCLECEASQVVIILQMYMVPLDNKCCAIIKISDCWISGYTGIKICH